MSEWRGLAARLTELRPHLPKQRADPRMDAATMAAAAWGIDRVIGLPPLVNIAALALSVDRLVVHEIRPQAVRLIDATDLHSLPDEPPRLMRGAWVVEVREPGREVLFGDIASLGGYELDGIWYLVGLGYPDGCTIARMRPAWRGGDLAAGVEPEFETSLLEGMDPGEHAEWGRAAARFVIVLGLLLDASGTPIRTRDEGPALAGRSKGRSHPARPWAVRRVWIDGAPQGTSVAGIGAGEGEAQEGRLAVESEVRGHLKRQPFGPGGKERRWIYVAGYEARRWVAPRPTKVVVGAREPTT